MTTAMILLQQIVIMFLLVLIGFVLYKTNRISDITAKGIGNILLFISLPAVIIKGFLVERSETRVIGLLISAGLALLVLVISAAVSRLIFRKDGIAAFSSAFSNPGFFGVPLIAASLAEGSVFYIAAFIGFLNLFQWTYGVAVMTGKAGRIPAKKILTAPFFVAICIGLVLFALAVPIPELFRSLIGSVAGLNTPLAMFVVGVYLAQVNIIKMFSRKENYMISFVRLVLLPLITVAVLMLVPDRFYDLKAAILIASACPVGSNVAVYAQLYDSDYTYAVETVIISTLLSIVTIPLLIQLI